MQSNLDVLCQVANQFLNDTALESIADTSLESVTGLEPVKVKVSKKTMLLSQNGDFIIPRGNAKHVVHNIVRIINAKSRSTQDISAIQNELEKLNKSLVHFKKKSSKPNATEVSKNSYAYLNYFATHCLLDEVKPHKYSVLSILKNRMSDTLLFKLVTA